MPVIETKSGYGYVYKSSVKKSKSMPKFFKITIWLFIILVVVFSGIYISSIIPNVFNIKSKIYFKTQTLFSVDAGAFEKYDTALILSEKIKQQGGAGFIRFIDNRYHVLLSCYTSKEDCLSVIDNLSQNNVDATMTSIKLEQFKNFFDDDNIDQTSIKSGVNCFYNTYTKLYSLSESYDRDILTKTEVLEEIDKILLNLDACINNLSTNVKNESNACLVYLKIYLKKMYDVVLDLTNNKNNFSGEIKYCYFDCLFNYVDFRQEIAK